MITSEKKQILALDFVFLQEYNYLCNLNSPR